MKTKSDRKSKEVAATILGAGFSYVAGLPITKDIFNTTVPPKSYNKTAASRNLKVLNAWRKWTNRTGCRDAEIWFRELYYSHNAELDITFGEAIGFAVGRLVILPDREFRSMPYLHGITCSVECEIHRRFWTIIRQLFELKSVVTMNYDILAEQGLKKKYSRHRTAPLCHYGGLPYDLFVRKMTHVTKREFDEIRLGKEIAIYKMHGSINWCQEPHGLKIHDDVRGVFRADIINYELLIVPPIPEKDRPEWLVKVWEYAEKGLRIATTWIVCGYSMPDYDQALRNFFTRAATGHKDLKLFILDPKAHDIEPKWKAIVPEDTEIILLPGLPEGLDELARHFRSS